MLKHVVLFKLKEYASAEEKVAALDTFETKLLALKKTISELKYIEVGRHFVTDSPSFDLCLITHFVSPEALEAYKIHPDHQAILPFVMDVTVARAAVDFEF